ncbi:enoyl-CoA hydratase-related protein [Angustibacter sp. Root456]|uniref:enoyl-CoA hydratase-related protein n=1 Tax=Angustibacter sp. Root456 TaxID=1736539 RepID=UPI00138F455F|nr:enoyl-CoA hydratase-related protein [Angustibacter sp. Root456]
MSEHPQPVTEVVVPDAGSPHRLDGEAVSALAGELRRARKAAGVVLVRVEGDAWHQAPPGELPDVDWAVDTVAGRYQAVVRQLFALDLPVVVHVDGAVSGLGLALAAAADLRVCSSRSTWAVGHPATALLGGTGWLLERLVGTGRYAHLAWTGRSLDAAQALAVGLVGDVDDDPQAGRALAEHVAALPAAATSALKRATASRHRSDLDVALGYESWLAGVAAGQ